MLKCLSSKSKRSNENINNFSEKIYESLHTNTDKIDNLHDDFVRGDKINTDKRE